MKSEARIQQECVMWFHNTYPDLRGCLFQVPNEGTGRTARQGKLLKQTGVIPGVSDLLLMVENKTYCFELKTEINIQSVKQKKWQKTIEGQGFDYYIIRNLEEFQNIIENII